MRTAIAIVPTGGIAAPTSGPVAAGSAATGYFLDTNGIGQATGSVPCLTSAGNLTIYAADLNSPSGGFAAGTPVLLAQMPSGRWWVQASPGWQSSLNPMQVQQQPGFAGF